MNEYILKVMRYLDNPELFSVEEMMENAVDAVDAAEAAAYADATYAYAANAANAYADCAYTAKAKHWINEYFKESGQNKQYYINEVERLKMNTVIKRGDMFFVVRDLELKNITSLKTYTCTKARGNRVFFINDKGEEDWHYGSMFTKTKESTPTIKPHKWADVIHQWADGEEIQCLINGVNTSMWITVTDPLFTQNGQYRIKPSEEEELKEKIDNQHQRMTKAFKHYQDICAESFKEIKKLKGSV